MLTLSNREYILNLFIVYFICNLFVLLNYDGVYWDDYRLINTDYESIKSMFEQATGGLNLAAPFHGTLLKLENSVFYYRAIGFSFFFVSVVYVFLILQQLNKNIDQNFIITLIYSIIPLNSAKVALINTPAIVFMALFYMAFFVFLKCIKTQFDIRYRSLLYLLFLLSFI